MDIVHNSADEMYFTKRHEGYHLKDNDCFKVLYFGSMFSYNGPQIVVDAFKEVSQKVPNIKLIILGDGPCLEETRKDAEQCNLGKHIIFEGRVPIDKLQDYIHEADIGVIPSLETPFTKINLPTRIMELIAMCKPVICSNLPGVQDYFNEEALLFFEPSNCSQLADHIINLYYYPQKSSVMTNKASESLDLIKWRETKKVYLKVISRLANNERLSC
jgi:glycosyltransferase involved in cell wall biosynthesis